MMLKAEILAVIKGCLSYFSISGLQTNYQIALT